MINEREKRSRKGKDEMEKNEKGEEMITKVSPSDCGPVLRSRQIMPCLDGVK